MSDKYKIYEQNKAYFIPMTIIGWIDIFTRPSQKQAMVNSLSPAGNYAGLEAMLPVELVTIER